MVVRDGEASGVLVMGLRRRDQFSRRIIVDNIVGGEVTDFGVAVGNRLSKRMGVRAGDGITLVAPNGATDPFGIMSRMKAFPVFVTFDVGMYEYDNIYIYRPRIPGAAAICGYSVRTGRRAA